LALVIDTYISAKLTIKHKQW